MLSKNKIFLTIFGVVVGAAIYFGISYFRLQNQLKDSEIEPSLAEFNITSHDHIWGNQDADLTLVIFSDYTCPYCREYYGDLKEFMENYNSDIKIVWKHFPLDRRNAESLGAANAAECAADQDKFWEFTDKLFTSQSILNSDLYNSIAKDLNLNQNKFENCVEDNKYKNKVQAHYTEGIAKGVIGTPANFLNGRYIPGALAYYDLAQLIDPLLDQ